MQTTNNTTSKQQELMKTAAELLAGVNVSESWISFFQYFLTPEMKALVEESNTKKNLVRDQLPLHDFVLDSDEMEEESEYYSEEERTPKEIIKSRSRTQWLPKEDETLAKLVKKYGCRWKKIRRSLPNKSVACLRTRTKYLCAVNPNLGTFVEKIRHIWSRDEDERLLRLVEKHGEDWSKIGKKMSRFGRNSTQCRTRWRDHLSITLSSSNNKKYEWTAEEDELLLEGYRMHHRQWSKIAALVPSKGYHAVRNRINSLALSRRVDAINKFRRC